MMAEQNRTEQQVDGVGGMRIIMGGGGTDPKSQGYLLVYASRGKAGNNSFRANYSLGIPCLELTTI